MSTPNTAADMGALLMVFLALCIAIPVLLFAALVGEIVRLAARAVQAMGRLCR